MKLKELYERPLKQIVEEMNLIDIKVYPGEGGEVNEILLKYAAAHTSQTPKRVSDEEQMWP